MLSDPEVEMAIARWETDGVRLYTSIGGYSGSSTRTELAAAILAISSHGPIHLGSDSFAFVTKANSILDDVREGRTFKRHWHLTADGDLWEHFHQIVIAKRPQAIRISWVKGHATEQQVADCIITMEQRQGNHQADAAADEGVKLHGETAVDFARNYSRRHGAYKKFYLQVTKHIIEGYLIHRELLRIRDAKQQKQQDQASVFHHYVPLWYPETAVATPLHFSCSI
jgi:ribonuclease HI